MKVFVTRELPERAVDLLKKEKLEVVVYPKDKPVSRNELIRNGKNSSAVIALLTDKFDRELIDKIPKCKIIANVAVGYNNIDVAYAAKKKIVVTNTPDVLTDSTSDLAMALILSCSRRLMEGEKIMREEKFEGWKPKLLLGIELRNKVVGILGAGKIGTETAIRAKAFKTEIVYFSRKRNLRLEKKTGAAKLSLNKLLRKSDIVSVHLPLTKETYHLLDGEKLSLLKKSAVLVNTSRGEIVDEKELIKILKQRKIFSAGLDVYENEPHINPELLKLNNVVLLPHIGSATEETRTEMAILAVKNVINVLKGEKALTPISV
jgi:glyoxylate reductase